MDLGFLDNLVIIDSKGLLEPKSKVPEGLTLRVFRNGAVYPSKQLVEEYDLDYKNKDEEDQGNYLDIVDSSEWEPLKKYPRIVLIGVVDRKEGKGDLFRKTVFDDDGKPINSVYNQGAVSKRLLELIGGMGLFDNEERKYIDMSVVTDKQVTATDGIYYLPKKVMKGERKGEDTYVRRENIKLFPLVPAPGMEKTTEVQQS